MSLYKHRAVQNERLLKGFMLVLVSSGIWHFGNILMFTFLTTRIFFAIVLICFIIPGFDLTVFILLYYDHYVGGLRSDGGLKHMGGFHVLL